MTSLKPIKTAVVQRWQSLDESWRFAISVFVIARLLFGLWSWVVYTIQPVAVQNFELAGEPILSVFRLRDSQHAIYLRQVNGETLSFRAFSLDLIMDQQTGTLWSISNGAAVQGQYSAARLSPPARTEISNIFPYQGTTPHPGRWLAMWQRFDANIYVSIAENGYGRIPGDNHFPPLFPLLIRVSQPLFGSAYLAGLLISHLAALYMLKLLYDVYSEWGGVENGKRSLLFFVVYPTFFFFFSAYSESVFLVCTLLALRNMKTPSWPWAGFWIFCAILTRLQGAALLIPMLYLMRADPPFLRKFSHWAGLFLTGLGGLFYLFLRALEGTGSVLPTVESEWQARLAVPGETYLYAIRTLAAGSASIIDLLNFVIATIFLLLIIVGWRNIPMEYNVFMAVNMLIILSRVVETQPLNSMLRFSLTLFPAFYTLGLIGKQPLARRIIVYASVLLALYLSGQFFIWGWVA